ncbi:epithelial sodium channel subunit gamma-like [Tachypleus tridentatus]|uniref:epithelial sodium channel subunit gamma-like n=1 Tax=Tachypleus tridentatus TaxID=6853 RepID=UPI003FCEF9FD
MVDSGFQLQDLIAYCSLWGTNNCRPWNHFYDNMFGNCYTVNAKWRNQSTEPLKAFSEGMSDIRSRQLNIIFYLDDSEFVDGKNAILTIQPPETSPNTWQEKYVIHAGSKTEFTVTMSTSHYLKSPYPTNCTDYIAMGETRGRPGILGLETCMMECEANRTFEKCGCMVEAPYSFVLERRIPLCAFGSTVSDPCVKETIGIGTKTNKMCREKCRLPCLRVNYDIIKEKTEWPRTLDEWPFNFVRDVYGIKNVSEAQQKFAFVTVTVGNKEHVIYSHLPKYQDIELFSYIGGYLGMWLGMSIFHMFDVVVTFISSVKSYVSQKQEVAPQADQTMSKRKTVEHSAYSIGVHNYP